MPVMNTLSSPTAFAADETKLYQGMPENSWPVVGAVAAFAPGGIEKMRLSTLMLRKSGQLPFASAPGHVSVQLPPVLQPLKMSWPNVDAVAERPRVLTMKSFISLRSFAAREMTLLKVVWAPFGPCDRMTETVTGAEVRLEMKTSEMKVPDPPAR